MHTLARHTLCCILTQYCRGVNATKGVPSQVAVGTAHLGHAITAFPHTCPARADGAQPRHQLLQQHHHGGIVQRLMEVRGEVCRWVQPGRRGKNINGPARTQSVPTQQGTWRQQTKPCQHGGSTEASPTPSSYYIETHTHTVAHPTTTRTHTPLPTTRPVPCPLKPLPMARHYEPDSDTPAHT